MEQTLILAAIVAFATGVFRGFAGFGAGMMMGPIVTLLYPATVVVPTLLGLSLLGDARLLPEVFKEVNVRRTLWVALPASIGLPLGIAALSMLDPEVIRRLVNVLVLVLVAVLARGARIKGADRPRVLAPAGVLGGMLNGVAGIGGPPVVLTYLSLDEPPTKTRANLIAYFALANSIGLVMMGLAGVLTTEAFTLLGACAVPFFIGIHIGSKLFTRSGSGSYRNAALGFLAIVAIVGLLWPVSPG